MPPRMGLPALFLDLTFARAVKLRLENDFFILLRLPILFLLGFVFCSDPLRVSVSTVTSSDLLC